jgi:hypothetical protein
MPRFNQGFLEGSFRRQLEMLLQVPGGPEKIVILSGLAGEEIVYPPADEGYVGNRPHDLADHGHELVTLAPSKGDGEDGPLDPPTTMTSCVDVHGQAESQTENWARYTFGANRNVITCRAQRPDISLETSAFMYLEKYRGLGHGTGILWPVYRTCVLEKQELFEHLAYHRSQDLPHGRITTLGEHLETSRLVDVSS